MKKFSAVSSQNSSFTHFKFPADNGTNFKDKPYRSPKIKKKTAFNYFKCEYLYTAFISARSLNNNQFSYFCVKLSCISYDKLIIIYN